MQSLAHVITCMYTHECVLHIQYYMYMDMYTGMAALLLFSPHSHPAKLTAKRVESACMFIPTYADSVLYGSPGCTVVLNVE